MFPGAFKTINETTQSNIPKRLVWKNESPQHLGYVGKRMCRSDIAEDSFSVGEALLVVCAV